MRSLKIYMGPLIKSQSAFFKILPHSAHVMFWHSQFGVVTGQARRYHFEVVGQRSKTFCVQVFYKKKWLFRHQWHFTLEGLFAITI